MRTKIEIGGLLFLVMTLSFSCLVPYQPPGTTNNASYLVVDALVNSAQGSAKVVLSHTVPLTSTDTLAQINDAEVTLQDDADNNFALNFEGSGIYSVTGLTLSPSGKYRLLITQAGKNYQSDLVPVQPSPPIDSVGWSIAGADLNINVSTHDPLRVSNFYRWRFTETWEYSAQYRSAFTIRNDTVIPRKITERVNTCWKTLNDQKINIYTTDYLTKDTVSSFNIQSIPFNSLKLTTNYSILVQQQTLTKAGYQYWLNVKKTTESLGSIFDPLPGAVVGNIKCITNPEEHVIGFFSVGEVTEKRIFIKRAEIAPFVTYRYPYCDVNIVPNNMVKNIRSSDLVIEEAYDPMGTFIGWRITSAKCADCRVLGGGNTVRPTFWKD